MTKYMISVICIVCLHLSTLIVADTLYGYENEKENLIKNGGFEADSFLPWEINKAVFEVSNTGHTGERSLIIRERTDRFGGLKQKVYNVTGNSTYYASAFVKILTNSNLTMYYNLAMWIGYQARNPDFYGRFRMARFPNVRTSARWRQLGGDFRTPDLDIEFIEVFIESRDRWVHYAMDDISIIPIPADPQWKEKANADIRKYRMNSVTFRAQFPGKIPYCKCEIKINQTRHHFGFGTAVGADKFIEDSDFGKNYRQFHYNHFNWGGFANALKWRPMEPSKGTLRFERVDTALDYFDAHNITVRGHSILWGVQKNNPDFVKDLTGEALREEINRRVEYVVTHYKGRLNEWDVVNEWLHGTFYDTATGDPLIQDKVYNMSRALDPEVGLYVNDYQALRLGDFTSALVDLADELHFRGAPVDGIGIQSHLKVPVPPEVLRKRTQILASSSSHFPLTITELSIHTTDVVERAERLDIALRTYFSNPGVQGIMFWLVGDQPGASFVPEEWSLFEGVDFTPNVAGKVYLELRKEWQTHVNFVPSAKMMSHRIHAFHGAYNVQVMCKGEFVKNQTFYLPPGRDIVVTLDLKNNDFPEVDPAEQKDCKVDGGDGHSRRHGKGYERWRNTNKKGKVRLGDPERGHKRNKSKRVSET